MDNFLIKEAIKSRIYNTMINFTSIDKQQDGVNCRIALITDFGIVDFGELFTRRPNTLYRQLKAIPSIRKVQVTIVRDLA